MTVRQLYRLAASLAMFILYATNAFSIPISSLNLEKMSTESDLIIVGTTGSFTTIRQVPMQLGSTVISANLEQTRVEILQILKGAESASSILVQVPVLRPPGGSVDLDGVPGNATRLLFLTRISDDRYQVVDPHYASLPGVTVSLSSQKLLENIGSVECGAISSKTEPVDSRLKAMWDLRDVDAECIIPTLRNIMSQQLPTLSLMAENELARRGDTASLSQIINDALSNQVNIPEYIRVNILNSIGDGVHDEAAIPILAPLLRSKRDDARLAGASALKNIGTKACIPDLRTLLSDPNQKARYIAVAALADISGQPHMHPSIPEFQRNESRYTSYWKEATRKRTVSPER